MPKHGDQVQRTTDEFLVSRGDFLIGMDGEFRCHIWKGPKALLNQRVCRLRHFAPSLDPMYLYYGIQKYLSTIEAQTAFVTVKHISGRQIQEISTPLPSIGEQRRIVDLLSRADNIVRMRREAEARAKVIIRARSWICSEIRRGMRGGGRFGGCPRSRGAI